MTSEEKIINDIQSFGWHFINVLEGEYTYQYTYTIGLYQTYGHPELFISGLPTELSSAILNNIVEDIKSGKQLNFKTESPDYIEGYNCYFDLVERLKYEDFFGKALWYYEGSGFPVLQIVWPDSQNKFPWEVESKPGQDVLIQTQS